MESVIFVLLIILGGVTRILTVQVKVSTPIGDIIGDRGNFTFAGTTYQVQRFKGIPYAESPTGERRFTKPVKKARFSEEYYALDEGMSCVQNTKLFPGLDQIPADEDCLSLNIYVPESASVNNKKTVMVFIYGGGFQFGTQTTYAAEALPALYDVVYVTLNYRLNVYGFLASKEHGLSGNYGLWDQHMAIRWIHDNIASFGGNPDQVTLFGESAGAASVMYQALYDGNKGLFNRIILQSGIVGPFWSYTKDPDFTFNNMVKSVGCERDATAEVISCLRQESLRFDEAYTSTLAIQGLYCPVHDGEFIKYDPANLYNITNPSSVEALRNIADFDIIGGINSHEGLLDMMSIGVNIPNLAAGLTLPHFNTYIDRFGEYAGNMFINTAVRTSVIHKYTDWNNPGDAISRRTSLLDLMSDTGMQVPTIQACTAHALTSANRQTYMYMFEHRSSFSKLPEWVTGADHADELPFMMGFPLFLMYANGVYDADPALMVPKSELELSKAMMKFWTQFAKFGNPNDDDTSNAWPVYEPGKGEYIVLKTNSSPFPVRDHFRVEYVDYWSNVYPRLVTDMGGTGTHNNCTYVTSSATSNVSHGIYIIMYFFVVVSLNVNIW